MIEVDRLTRRYGEFVAVSNISFKIEQGEIVGLLGHNGAGKTTIMKMLTGFLEPSGGSVRVDGVNIEEDPLTVQARLGYLPESLPLYPELSVSGFLRSHTRRVVSHPKIATLQRISIDMFFTNIPSMLPPADPVMLVRGHWNVS